jgi:hypothetical protein
MTTFCLSLCLPVPMPVCANDMVQCFQLCFCVSPFMFCFVLVMSVHTTTSHRFFHRLRSSDGSRRPHILGGEVCRVAHFRAFLVSTSWSVLFRWRRSIALFRALVCFSCSPSGSMTASDCMLRCSAQCCTADCRDELHHFCFPSRSLHSFCLAPWLAQSCLPPSGSSPAT